MSMRLLTDDDYVAELRQKPLGDELIGLRFEHGLRKWVVVEVAAHCVCIGDEAWHRAYFCRSGEARVIWTASAITDHFREETKSGEAMEAAIADKKLMLNSF